MNLVTSSAETDASFAYIFSKDKGTVVGNLEESNEISIDNFTIGSVDKNIIKATPSVRLLAKKLGVDLQTVIGSGEHGVITRQDIETIANKLADKIIRGELKDGGKVKVNFKADSLVIGV